MRRCEQGLGISTASADLHIAIYPVSSNQDEVVEAVEIEVDHLQRQYRRTLPVHRGSDMAIAMQQGTASLPLIL